MNDKTIRLTPRKEFFINMITKDITLEVCILELIDNSIDGSIRADIKNPIIDIEFNDDKFIIKDNCGGIPLDIAKNYAFNFGRSDEGYEKSQINESIGRFGIGMKRSIFKFGKNIEIESNDGKDSYLINLDVDAWKVRDEWDLTFTETLCKDVGTVITITNLNNGIEKFIKGTTFLNDICRLIASKFREKLNSNTLTINIDYYDTKKVIKASDYDEKLVDNDLIQPIIEEYMIGDVQVKFVVGAITRVKEGKYEPKKAGWYLFCNNRMVLEAEQSQLTGWGTNGLAQFHVQTARRFRGYCYLTASDSRNLPWNTMKSSVEEESDLYIQLKNDMINLTTKYLMIIDKLEELDETNNTDKNLIEEYDSKGTQVNRQIVNNNLNVSDVVSRVVTKLPEKITISYKKDRNEVNAIQKEYGISNASEVGRMTYNYFLEMEDFKWD